MGTPVIGDILESTVGKAIGKTIDKLAGHFLPESMTEEERAKFKLEAERLAFEEAKAVIADTQGARGLAMKESEGAPGWTKILTVTHRPVWSFLVLGLFSWTVLAPYFGFPNIELGEIHKDVMQTVIIFYFGGRSIEKTMKVIKGV